jgi:hypothetical protein
MEEQMSLDLNMTFTPPITPKLFRIIPISAAFACKLNKKWHSRLPIIDWSNVVRNTYSICYGAEWGGTFWAVAIWSSPVAQNRFKDGKTILELRRLAISGDAPKFTATRMISQMVKDIKKRFPEIKRLISYQDTEVHSGTIYKASNWVAVTESRGLMWNTEKRKRSPEQTTAKKIRWELQILHG